MTLDEIRTLLQFRDAPDQDCVVVSTLIDDQIEDIGFRIASLLALKEHLTTLRRLCMTEQPAKKCGILKDLAMEAQTNVPHQ